MKRLTSIPTTRFVFPASEPVVTVEHIDQPNLYVELMESASRITMGIAAVLVAATIISQLTKRPEAVPVVSERVNWGAR